MIEQGAPMTTPPEMVAFSILYIYKPLPKDKALITYVPMQLPTNASTVLTTIRFC